jgi:predicted RNA-binding protein with TRAM domain
MRSQLEVKMAEWKKNDRIQVLIEDLSETGEGIGKTDGFTWFIKDTVIGDQVEAKAMKVKKILRFCPFRTNHHALRRQNYASVPGSEAVWRLSAPGYEL